MHFWERAAGPLLYAHRGASSELLENSIPAFKRALELGADVLELDVHPSRDGVFVVSHDPTGERLWGVPQRIADCDWSEISRWSAVAGVSPARLEQVLDEFPETPLNVDVKLGREAEIRRLTTLLRARQAEPRVLLTSFSWRCLRRIRLSGYAGALGLSELDVVGLRFAPEPLVRLLPLGVRVQIPVRSGPIDLSHPAFIDKCHRLGLKVDYWVINDPVEAKELLGRGADGLFTDDVAAIAPLFR